MRISLRYLSPGIRAAATAAVWGYLSAGAAAQQMPPTLVVTDSVQRLEFHEQIRQVGRTLAWSESKVTSEVTGRIAQIQAREGVWVDAGQPLVELDCERIRLSFESKDAEAQQARLAADLAATQLARTRELFDRNLISQTALDSAETWAQIQGERYRQLESDRSRLDLDRQNCVIRAPFAGYTGRRFVDIGEWVQVGDPVFELVDISRIRVEVDLPERYFGHLAVGSRVTVIRQSDEEHELEGRVTGIGARASEETHTFLVNITVPNASTDFAGGMVVRVILSLNEKSMSLAVPKDAIVRQAGQTLVYSVADGKALPLPVKVTSTDGQLVAVTGEGLLAGMPVVVRGNERIFPGSPVMVAGAVPEATGEAAGPSDEQDVP